MQADTIALPVAGMISAMWFMENSWMTIKEKEATKITIAIKGLWIPLASLALWIMQFYQVSDSPVFQVVDYGLSDFIIAISNYCYYILDYFPNFPFK